MSGSTVDGLSLIVQVPVCYRFKMLIECEEKRDLSTDVQ